MPERTPRKQWQFGSSEPRQFTWLAGRMMIRVLGSVIMALLLLMHREWPVGVQVLSGTVLISFVAGLLVRFHLEKVGVETTTPRVAERLIWSTAVFAVLGVQIVVRALKGPEIVGPDFLLMGPLAAQAMLVSALLGPSVAVVALTITSLLLGSTGALPVEMLAASWLAGTVGAHVVNPLKQRMDLLRAVSIQVGVQAVIATCVAAVAVSSAILVLESAAWAAIAAVVATSIFWLGVAVLERAFGIVSDYTLIELCSPEQPLIRDLCLRAPGTYAHSVAVANLAENAARTIGANPVLVRAMAYYHDVGKVLRPSYFIENQNGENVHDDMSPTLSARVILAHVKDGVDMAKKHRLPQVIVDAIQQHHGTGLMSYFFHKAVQQGLADQSDAVEGLFRYEGPKAQTREVAIVHLADTIEAASRTLGKEDKIEALVAQVIEGSRADGQLDECDLSFRDVQKISASFILTLGAIRHERVAYPGQESNDALSEASGYDREGAARPHQA